MDSSTDTQDQDTSHRQALGRGQGSSSIVYSAGAVTRGRNRTVTQQSINMTIPSNSLSLAFTKYQAAAIEDNLIKQLMSVFSC